MSIEKSGFRRAVLIGSATILVTTTAFVGALATARTYPPTKLMTVWFAEVPGNRCEIDQFDSEKLVEKSKKEGVLLRLDNTCKVQVDVKVTDKSGVFTCSGQPNAVLGKEFPIDAGMKAYLDCSLDYSAVKDDDYKVVIKKIRGSELALEAIP